MDKGRFIAVVGPSGVGKDSVMEGLIEARPTLRRVRRVITRAADAGGEDFEAVSSEDFAKRAVTGAFALQWQAHGLSYGIPHCVHETLGAGGDVLANLSRGMLTAAAKEFTTLIVLHITASDAILQNRLAQRGREQGAEIAKRLARKAPDFPADLRVVHIDNSGPLDAAIAAALSAIYPARG